MNTFGVAMELEWQAIGALDAPYGGRSVRQGPIQVNQRSPDGYVNATAMCIAAGKSWSSYRGTASTERFLSVLGDMLGTATQLVVADPAGDIPRPLIVWVHPRVAVHLGQWLSPEFAVLVTDTVLRQHVAARIRQDRLHERPDKCVDLGRYYQLKPMDRGTWHVHLRVALTLSALLALIFMFYLD